MKFSLKMSKLQDRQTPMSTQLTTMLLFLRDDSFERKNVSDLVHPEHTTIDSGSDHDAVDEGFGDIILGGEICNCKKSKCLKLYCQCFNATRVCNQNCRCTSCSNTNMNEIERSEAVKIILERNPSAFDTKFLIYNLLAKKAAHKSGCKCRKSMCLKKYCECYEALVPCSSSCVCVDCHNTSGVATQRRETGTSSSDSAVLSKIARSSMVGADNKSKISNQSKMQQNRPKGSQAAASVSVLDECSRTSEDRTPILDRCPLSATLSRRRSGDSPASSMRGISDVDVDADRSVGIPISSKRRKSCVSSRDSGPYVADDFRSSAAPSIAQSPVEDGAEGVKTDYNREGEDTVCGHYVSLSVYRDNPNPRTLPDCYSLSTPSSTKTSQDITDTNRELPSLSCREMNSSKAPNKTKTNTSSKPDIIGRFISPNTASVASALSLLSRLPFY